MNDSRITANELQNESQGRRKLLETNTFTIDPGDVRMDMLKDGTFGGEDRVSSGLFGGGRSGKDRVVLGENLIDDRVPERRDENARLFNQLIELTIVFCTCKRCRS